MLEELRHSVCAANLAMVSGGLAFRQWGSVSGVDRLAGLMAITPVSGAHDGLKWEHLAVVSLESVRPAEASPRPCRDAPTHAAIYRRLAGIGAVACAHGPYATAWAQARKAIAPLGTVHADCFRGPVPCTRALTDDEIAEGYDAKIAQAIAEALGDLSPEAQPGVLVANLGQFAFGRTPDQAVERAVIIEHLARLASLTIEIEPYPKGISAKLLDVHYLRGQASGPDNDRK
jgi:L-ribulose-5-phosphate 4-epimerase